MRNRTKILTPGLLMCLIFIGLMSFIPKETNFQTGWPQITKESKPWARWWWMGSAVDEPNLIDLISRYGKAGFGGLEITPIYGAVGYEAKYLSFLSPEWMKMLDVSVSEARKNGMGIDMNTGTGWPFGGPQITLQNAAAKIILQKYSVSAGGKLTEKILPTDKRQLEAGAFLQAVTAYGKDGKIEDLTSLVKPDGTLLWVAEKQDWEIYAAFCGKTLQKVKRAAPGGEGLTFDHFSKEALTRYLSRFDSAFNKSNHGVGSFFNDSYEVYGTNWSASIFKEFEQRRGYSLQPYLRELAEKLPLSEISRRVQCDYRETISDMLLENFTQSWTNWAHGKGSLTRNQAHGSPGNLLDLYATVDIPECETFGSSHFDIPGLRRDSADVRNVDPDPVMMKFASSAANVSGDPKYADYTMSRLKFISEIRDGFVKLEEKQPGVKHAMYRTLHPQALDDCGAICAAMIKTQRQGFDGDLKPLIQLFIDYISNKEFRFPDGTIEQKPERIKDLKASIDLMLASEKIDDWTWIDALQMAMPVYAKLGVLYKDNRYFERMYQMYNHSKNIQGGKGLYNPKDNLWWRDKDFVPPYKEPNGEDCYWSRGNGWVLAALVRVLEIMPKDAPHRKEYQKTFEKMSKALIPIQRTDGFWNVSLHDPNNFGGKELTGTALFAYGMVWGINHGILSKKKYQPIVIKAWNAMVNDAVHPNSFLGHVQGTGKQPSDSQPTSYDRIPNFEDYGLGCFLLAGSEVYQMKN